MLLLLALAPSAALPASPNFADTIEPDAPRQFQSAPDAAAHPLKLPDLRGSQHDLKQLTGRIVLVHFFATWCEPCRPELASLSKLAARKGGPKLTVLAVNVAEPPARLHRFFEKAPVNFPVLVDETRAVTKAWGVSLLPTTFVLDHQGAVRLHVEGDLDWMHADVLARLEALESTNQN